MLSKQDFRGIKRAQLMKTKRENVLRLARWLGLKIGDDWSHKHIASLVYWRISRRER